MFNNFVNFHDLALLIWGIKHGYLSVILSRLTKGKTSRVKDQWKITNKERFSWWIIPEVLKRYNYLITGDENVSYYQYVSEKYFSNRENLIGLSLGCGTGKRELEWVRFSDFRKIEAYDISESSIDIARQEAREAGYANIIDYKVGDIYSIELAENRYDAIFVEQSLHHFSPLEALLARISKWLSSSGLLVVNEYVGPSRFQWTDRQLEIANKIRSILPGKYRTHIVDGSVNKKIVRPSRLSMIMRDPSEAVESSKIMPLLNRMFEIVEVRPYYGAILHLLFEGIAPNFLSQDEEGQKYLRLCFEIEDIVTETGQVQSDFALIVCKKKT